MLGRGARLLELRPLGHRHIIVRGEEDEEEPAAAMASAAPAMLVATVVMAAVAATLVVTVTAMAVVFIVDAGGKEGKLKDSDEELDALSGEAGAVGGVSLQAGL